MPSRNLVKQYVEGGYYHVYNRGVEKRLIFMDDQDRYVFIKYLRSYLTSGKEFEYTRHPRPDLSGKVGVLAYCLMPNHYHLLIRQENSDGMTELMRRAMTGYGMYFNLRHHRVGSLFQSRFKAVLIESDEYLMHVSRYIHLNPVKIGASLERYKFSSLREYLTGHSTWISTGPVLRLFNNDRLDYARFVNDMSIDSEVVLGDLKLKN